MSHYGSHVGFTKQEFPTLHSIISHYHSLKYNCIQVYIGNNQSLKRNEFTKEDLDKCLQFINNNDFKLYTHSCLCMNLASGFRQNVDCLLQELKPVIAVGGSTVVHIGSKNVNKQPIGTLDNIVKTIKALNLPRDCKTYPLLLENSAGEGGKFGSTIWDLKYLFEQLKDEPIGFCLDTAHTFAAGLCRFDSIASIKSLFFIIEKTIGVGRLKLVHLNDSKIDFGGKVDRHENLGKGYIWKDKHEMIKVLFQECKNRNIDIILETPNPLEDYELLKTF